MRLVTSRMSDTRLTPVSVAADGTLLIPNRAVTVQKTATGTYLLTFDRSHQQAPFAFGSPIVGGGARHILQFPKASITPKSMVVKAYTIGDVVADTAFDLLVLGSDGGAPTFAGMSSIVRAPIVNGRLMLLYYDGVNAALSGGKNQAYSFVKTGTGLYTLTLKLPFAKNFYAVAGTNATNRHVEVTGKTHKTVSFEAFNSSSGAAADTEIFVMLMGGYTQSTQSRKFFPLKSSQPWTVLNPFEYDGVGDAMVRGGTYVSAVKAGTGSYDFTFKRNRGFAGFGLATADGAAVLTAINNRTGSGMHMDAEADARVYGLDVGFMRGRALT